MTDSNQRYGLGGKVSQRKPRWWYATFLTSLSIFCMSLATQRIAGYFNYNQALGKPVFSIFYAPWSVFIWQSTFILQDCYRFMERAITESQILFLVPQYLIIGCWLFCTKNLGGNDILHGSARWATETEIRRMGYLDGAGVYIGGYSRSVGGLPLLRCFLLGKPPKTLLYLRHNGPEHILVFAPTRSGKGVGLILPTLLAWGESALILDIKGENWALTGGYRRSQGHRVLRFDPADASGASASFNPLAELRLASLLAIPDAQNIATMLVDPEGRGLEDHWSKAAFALLGGAILHCCIMVRSKDKRDANLHDLACMLADESKTIQKMFEEMISTDHESILNDMFSDITKDYGSQAHTFIASAGREMLNKSENEASSVVSTAIVNLALYRDPVVTMNTSRNDFYIHDLMNYEAPVSLYLVISPSDIDRLRPLVRLIVDMIIRSICAKMEFSDGKSIKSYKYRLLILLDEFTSLGKLPIMEKALAYIAGYGGKIYLIVQDITQLLNTYGKENSIMANCHIRIAYAPNTISTANTLSEMTGKTTVVAEKTSLSGSRTGHLKNASVSVSETARPLLTPDECMRLPGMVKDGQGRVLKAGDMLIFTAGKPPIYGRQILYFMDPVFSRRAKIPVPGLSTEYPGGVSDSLHCTLPRGMVPSNQPGQGNSPDGTGESYAYFH